MLKKMLFMVALALSIAGVVAEEWKFDFGPKDLVTGKDWVRVSEKEFFTVEKGYGWTQHWGYSNRIENLEAPLNSYTGAQTNQAEGIFKLQCPNGVYLVTVTLGSNIPSEGRDGQCVEINGKNVLPPPGVGGWGKLEVRTLPAIVTDGLMTIRFYTPKTKSTHRLNLYALQISTAPDDKKAELEKAFADALATLE